ncbi:MAG: hypothetical protein IJR87_02325 [Bacteroidaceae bacterium]|nr:hypothetical protein [Bacteroidaceae bacterium]
MIAALLWSGEGRAWGESTSYVLTHADEESLNTISTGESMALSGPGAKLTFQAKRQTLAVNYFFVQISTNGGSSWSDLANPSLSTSYASYSYDISTDVTHIRFITKTGATLKKYYKDVKVTRATTLSTSTTSLDFGTITNRRSSTLNALIDYNNTTYNQQVTGTCTDANFTVTATTVGETGSSTQIPVVFTPTSAGTHTGTVTLTMNGKTVSFQVTGVGQTTYYTRATATATTGGSAYVSFSSFEGATNSSATTNSGVTTASNASATAYYRAVANQRYAFLGWKANLSDANYVSTDAEFQTTVTYTSESSSSPTVVTYYAVFEEKPNVITLEPTSSTYDTDLYETVTLHRTFLEGYNTIALPFETNVQTLTGRSGDDDWVAQLSAVTYNQYDGYTLFFEKVASGRIKAFEPYILYLGEQVVNPSFTNIDLPVAAPVTITPSKGYPATVSPDGSSYTDWQMTSNFTAGFNMSGKYGIVNAEGGLKLGASGSFLNAFTAYITPPAGANGVKVRSAFLDFGDEGTALEDVRLVDEAEVEGYYSVDGRRLARPQKGIVVVKYRDGRRMKVKFY